MRSWRRKFPYDARLIEIYNLGADLSEKSGEVNRIWEEGEGQWVGILLISGGSPHLQELQALAADGDVNGKESLKHLRYFTTSCAPLSSYFRAGGPSCVGGRYFLILVSIQENQLSAYTVLSSNGTGRKKNNEVWKFVKFTTVLSAGVFYFLLWQVLVPSHSKYPRYRAKWTHNLGGSNHRGFYRLNWIWMFSEAPTTSKSRFALFLTVFDI